jgi:DNA modification methylase
MIRIIYGDALDVLSREPSNSVHCCVTSPPYWGLRNYGSDGQLGLEKTPQEYVGKLVDIFRQVRRVLRKDGTFWLNLGDTYATGSGSARSPGGKLFGRHNPVIDAGNYPRSQPNRMPIPGLKPKDLVGIPWRVAFALQADGWYLRSEIIWHKRNAMPESVSDRPTKSHEHVFLFSKSGRPTIWRAKDTGEWNSKPDLDERILVRDDRGEEVPRWRSFDYYYEADAIREPHGKGSEERSKRGRGLNHKYTNGQGAARAQGFHTDVSKVCHPKGRNKRTVWDVPARPFKGAHFATFPPKLIEPCILAGCPEGGVVLDPFFGAGTVGVVAAQTRRGALGIELNPEYCRIAEERIREEAAFLPFKEMLGL